MLTAHDDTAHIFAGLVGSGSSGAAAGPGSENTWGTAAAPADEGRGVVVLIRDLSELTYDTQMARQISAEDFCRLGALRCIAMAWIFIIAHCFAIP